MKTREEVLELLQEIEQRRKKARTNYVRDYLTAVETALTWVVDDSSDRP